jgi:hypothetical protein
MGNIDTIGMAMNPFNMGFYSNGINPGQVPFSQQIQPSLMQMNPMMYHGPVPQQNYQISGYPQAQMPFGGFQPMYSSMQNPYNLIYNQVNNLAINPNVGYNPANEYNRQQGNSVPSVISLSNQFNQSSNSNTYGKVSPINQNFGGNQPYQNKNNESQAKQVSNVPAPNSLLNTKPNTINSGNSNNPTQSTPKPFGAPIKVNNLKTTNNQQTEQTTKKQTVKSNQDPKSQTLQQDIPKVVPPKSNNKKSLKAGSKAKDKKVDEEILDKLDEFPKLG